MQSANTNLLQTTITDTKHIISCVSVDSTSEKYNDTLCSLRPAQRGEELLHDCHNQARDLCSYTDCKYSGTPHWQIAAEYSFFGLVVLPPDSLVLCL